MHALTLIIWLVNATCISNVFALSNNTRKPVNDKNLWVVSKLEAIAQETFQQQVSTLTREERLYALSKLPSIQNSMSQKFNAVIQSSTTRINQLVATSSLSSEKKNQLVADITSVTLQRMNREVVRLFGKALDASMTLQKRTDENNALEEHIKTLQQRESEYYELFLRDLEALSPEYAQARIEMQQALQTLSQAVDIESILALAAPSFDSYKPRKILLFDRVMTANKEYMHAAVQFVKAQADMEKMASIALRNLDKAEIDAITMTFINEEARNYFLLTRDRNEKGVTNLNHFKQARLELKEATHSLNALSDSYEMRLYAARNLNHYPPQETKTLLRFMLQEHENLENYVTLIHEYQATHFKLLEFTEFYKLEADTAFLLDNLGDLKTIQRIEQEKLFLKKETFNFITKKIDINRLGIDHINKLKIPRVNAIPFEQLEDVFHEAFKSFKPKPLIFKRQSSTVSASDISTTDTATKVFFKKLGNIIIKPLKFRGLRILFRYFKSLVL